MPTLTTATPVSTVLVRARVSPCDVSSSVHPVPEDPQRLFKSSCSLEAIRPVTAEPTAVRPPSVMST
jgi:hypothetical protein